MKEHVITNVIKDSIARELEIEPGDVLLSIDGQEIEDVFDYRYLLHSELITVLIRKQDGEEWELEIEKEEEEDLGLEFSSGLMGDYRSCSNHCMFCFIDQLPRGMRSTLYFKDDDSRLSFLQGNYITLTNMSDHDIDRMIRYHLEPINISFHTFNPALRCRMLHNRFAGDIFRKVDRLFEAGIEMNGQIVLCRGINDGDELDASLKAMERYVPCLKSLSVVPVGLTRYREGLYPLEPFTPDDARRVLAQIHAAQQYYYEKYGYHLVHAGDEWYILAGEPLPEADTYDGYLQIENGVGMVRSLLDEVDECLAGLEEERAHASRRKRGGEQPEKQPPRHVSIACGQLAAPFLRQITEKVKRLYPHLSCRVYAIRNDFFGERITVSGLLTGQDLKAQLAEKDLGDCLLLTCSMLRSGEEVFLDDVTVSELSESLSVPIRVVQSTGEDLVHALLGAAPDETAEPDIV